MIKESGVSEGKRDRKIIENVPVRPNSFNAQHKPFQFGVIIRTSQKLNP